MFPFADNNPTHRSAAVTYTLILINVLAFLWYSRLSEEERIAVTFQRGFIPARIQQLREPREMLVKVGQPKLERIGLFDVQQVQPVVRLQPDRREIFLSLLTCMFLHGGWMHLIGNMWFLFLFGNNVEDRLGHVLFLIFYLLGGLTATGAHYFFEMGSTIPVIGASGAVSAVLGAYAVTYPHARVHTLIFLFIFITVIDVPAWVVLGLWFLGQLMDAYGQIRLNVDGGVAFMAHVGGFVFGAVMMPLLNALIPHPHARKPAYYEPGDEPDWP